MTAWILVTLICISGLAWGQPLVGHPALQADRPALDVEAETEGTEECSALQLKSQTASMSGGNDSGMIFAPAVVTGAGAAAAAEEGAIAEDGQQLSLLRTAAQRTAAALFDSSRIRTEQQKLQETLDFARVENSKAKGEVAMLLQKNAHLEHQLVVQQALAERGTFVIPIPLSFWKHDHFWLFLILIVGSAGLTLIACVLWHRRPRRRVRWTGGVKKAGKGQSADSVITAKAIETEVEGKYVDSVGRLAGSSGLEKLAEEEEEGEIDSRICGCPASFWFVCIVWNTGLAVMFHLGMLQPLLRQLIVFLMIAIALLGILFLVTLEAWMRLKGRFQMVMEFLEGFHTSVDEILTVLGFRPEEVSSEDEPTDQKSP